MVEIAKDEEFTRDWDWYAFDDEGNIGHFTTAGLRALPKAVKHDKEAAERLARYFFEEASDSGGYSVRDGAEADAGGWQRQGAERYLKDFAKMGSKGIFSYNTEMRHGHGGKYYLVAKPECPLRVTDLPPDIKAMVSRIHAPLSFETAEYVSETDTLSW